MKRHVNNHVRFLRFALSISARITELEHAVGHLQAMMEDVVNQMKAPGSPNTEIIEDSVPLTELIEGARL